MAETFTNATFGAAQASAGTYVLGKFTTTNLLSGATPVTINGSLTAPGSTVQVGLNLGGTTITAAQGTYLGYSAVPNSQDFVYYLGVSGANIPTPVTIAVTPATALPTLNATAVTTASVDAPVSATPVCFASGTRIRTTRGEIPVEQLSVGDLVVTASGAQRPILWLGRRSIDCAAHHDPLQVMPVRIGAGAFGTNVPSRDLVVSPHHRLFVNGALVHADRLVNGWSITRDLIDEVTYWHVELESHDVLLAEGLPAESYLDTGNRSEFEHDGSVMISAPRLDPVGAGADDCAPTLAEGPELASIKTWLLTRARQFGGRYTNDPGVALMVDGLLLTPDAIDGDRFRFKIPEGTEALILTSRASIAAEVNPHSEDRRKLGVLVKNLMVDGQRVPMDDRQFARGWNEPELSGHGWARWTRGEAALPIGCRIEFRLESMSVYAVDPPEPEQHSATRTAVRLRAVA